MKRQARNANLVTETWKERPPTNPWSWSCSWDEFLSLVFEPNDWRERTKYSLAEDFTVVVMYPFGHGPQLMPVRLNGGAPSSLVCARALPDRVDVDLPSGVSFTLGIDEEIGLVRINATIELDNSQGRLVANLVRNPYLFAKRLLETPPLIRESDRKWNGVHVLEPGPLNDATRVIIGPGIASDAPLLLRIDGPYDVYKEFDEDHLVVSPDTTIIFAQG